MSFIYFLNINLISSKHQYNRLLLQGMVFSGFFLQTEPNSLVLTDHWTWFLKWSSAPEEMTARIKDCVPKYMFLRWKTMPQSNPIRRWLLLFLLALCSKQKSSQGWVLHKVWFWSDPLSYIKPGRMLTLALLTMTLPSLFHQSGAHCRQRVSVSASVFFKYCVIHLEMTENETWLTLTCILMSQIIKQR